MAEMIQIERMRDSNDGYRLAEKFEEMIYDYFAHTPLSSSSVEAYHTAIRTIVTNFGLIERKTIEYLDFDKNIDDDMFKKQHNFHLQMCNERMRRLDQERNVKEDQLEKRIKDAYQSGYEQAQLEAMVEKKKELLVDIN